MCLKLWLVARGLVRTVCVQCVYGVCVSVCVLPSVQTRHNNLNPEIMKVDSHLPVMALQTCVCVEGRCMCVCLAGIAIQVGTFGS